MNRPLLCGWRCKALPRWKFPPCWKSAHGYLTALLDALAVPAEARGKILDFLRAKNAHELRTAALDAGLDASAAEALTGLLALHGPMGATLTAARAACRCEAQRAA